MPLTRPWSDSSPPGSALANQIDTEIQKVRLDVRERIDVEHNFPAVDDTTTGAHRQGSGRDIVSTYANLVANLITAFPSGVRIGRAQYSTDRQVLSIVTADGITTDIAGKRRFTFMSIPIFAQFALQAFVQSNTAIDLNPPNVPLLTDLDANGIRGIFPDTTVTDLAKIEARVIAVGTSTTTATTLSVRVLGNNITVTIATSGTLHTGAWTALSNSTPTTLFVQQQGTNPNAFTLARVEVQLRLRTD